MKKLLILSLIFLSACGPQKPDYVDSKGDEYSIRSRCVKSHTKSVYEYHYGYSFSRGRWCWHWGLNNKTICDLTVYDTVQINLKEKYYK